MTLKPEIAADFIVEESFVLGNDSVVVVVGFINKKAFIKAGDGVILTTPEGTRLQTKVDRVGFVDKRISSGAMMGRLGMCSRGSR